MFSREVANKNTQISRRLGKEQRCHARKRQERNSIQYSFHVDADVKKLSSSIVQDLINSQKKSPALKQETQNDLQMFSESETAQSE